MARRIDGLSIVHPAYGLPYNKKYQENMFSIVESCYSDGRPVFLIDDKQRPLADKRMVRLFSRALKIPDFNSHGVFLRQSEINYICGKIGKPPDSVTLGFGGLYAGHCVYAYAVSWCSEIETEYRPALLGRPRIIKPIKKGIIMSAIV